MNPLLHRGKLLIVTMALAFGGLAASAAAAQAAQPATHPAATMPAHAPAHVAAVWHPIGNCSSCIRA